MNYAQAIKVAVQKKTLPSCRIAAQLNDGN
jgi:hypothetical protein